MVARKRRYKGPLLITLAVLAVVLLSVLLINVSMNAINAETGASVFANLVSGPDNNGTANWSAEGTAPADQGDWYYSTTAIVADGSTVRTEGSYFQVLP